MSTISALDAAHADLKRDLASRPPRFHPRQYLGPGQHVISDEIGVLWIVNAERGTMERVRLGFARA